MAFWGLAGLQFTDAPPEESTAALFFYKVVGLPATFADVGLGNCERDGLIIAAEKACARGASIHHEAGEMTPDKVYQAILVATLVENTGRRRSIHPGIGKAAKGGYPRPEIDTG